MIPVLFAVCVMIWLWAAAMRHAVQALAGAATPAQQRVYLAMAVFAGAVLVVAAVYQAMPLSVLSAGWSQERLTGLTTASVVAALVVSVLAIFRAHLLLPVLPGVKRPVPAGKKPARPQPNKKGAE